MFTEQTNLSVPLAVAIVLSLGILPGISTGEQRALILAARSGDAVQNDANLGYCVKTRDLLQALGFSQTNISIFVDGGDSALKGSAETIKPFVLRQLEDIAAVSKQDDEFWLFIYGYADANAKGLFLATKEGRLSARELAEALDRIHGTQKVFCFNQQSAGFMTSLSRNGRVVITAADAEGQVNPPLFPKYFLDAWINDRSASLERILIKAAEGVFAYYRGNGMALPESPAIFNGKSLLKYPFEKPKADVAATAVAASGNADEKEPAEQTKPADSAKKKPEDAEKGAKFRKSTPEELALLAEARSLVAKYSGFSSFTFREDRKLIMENDGGRLENWISVVYLLKDVAAEKYGTIMIRDEPPRVETSIEQATTVYPDGNSLDVESDVAPGYGRDSRLALLKFDELRKGCLIILKRKTVSRADASLPFLYEDIQFQSDEPVKRSCLSLSLPAGREFQTKLYNSRSGLKETLDNKRRLISLELTDIPAFESLPNDPPAQEALIHLRVTSLKSWKEFEEWCLRILKDSDVMDDKTAALARSLARNGKTDTEKLKAIYNFICELRYETTPIGISALRPRKPSEVCSSLKGDCKEKANTLVAMAKSLGIDGCFVLLNRMSATDTDFPGFQFNHAIAFFPRLEGYRDGLWCDATDGSTPFGTLPPGDIGRSGLVFGTNGATFKTVTLPKGNTSKVFQEVELAPRSDGSVSGKFTLEVSGIPEYRLRQVLKRASPALARNALQGLVNSIFTGLHVTKYDYTSPEDLSENFKVSGELAGEDWQLTRKHVSPCADYREAFSSPSRDRALILNDGQPFLARQRIVVKGDKPAKLDPSKWETGTGLFKAAVSISSDGSSWTRETSMEFREGKIAPEDYEGVRKRILEFLRRSGDAI